MTFPSSDGRVSQSAENLIRSLLTESENRLDYDGIRNHAFFDDVDFDNIRQSTADCFVCDTANVYFGVNFSPFLLCTVCKTELLDIYLFSRITLLRINIIKYVPVK